MCGQEKGHTGRAGGPRVLVQWHTGNRRLCSVAEQKPPTRKIGALRRGIFSPAEGRTGSRRTVAYSFTPPEGGFRRPTAVAGGVGLLRNRATIKHAKGGEALQSVRDEGPPSAMDVVLLIRGPENQGVVFQ